MDKDDVVRKALRFPIEPVLKLYMKWFGVSDDEAHEHELELKRCLALLALNKGRQYRFGNAPITNLWRTFIVFTVLYTEFCTSVSGAYLHYTPAEAQPVPKGENVRSYQELLRDYQAVFKTEPPSHLWPQAQQDQESLRLDAELAFDGR